MASTTTGTASTSDTSSRRRSAAVAPHHRLPVLPRAPPHAAALSSGPNGQGCSSPDPEPGCQPYRPAVFPAAASW
jgi:hypothetical protein